MELVCVKKPGDGEICEVRVKGQDGPKNLQDEEDEFDQAFDQSFDEQ